MFDFLKPRDKPDTIPEKRFDSDRKEQITEEVSKSNLEKGYDAYISAYQEYVDVINQIDTGLSYKHDVNRLRADHSRDDIIDHLSYLSRAEDRIEDTLSDEYDVRGYLYLLFLAQSQCRELLTLLDLYADDE
jgi:hypothetical protein